MKSMKKLNDMQRKNVLAVNFVAVSIIKKEPRRDLLGPERSG